MIETTGILPTRQDFSDAKGTTFSAQSPENTEFELCLVEVNEGVSNATQDSFSLIFRAEASAPPVQSIYRLENEGLGSMDLFLVPVKKDEGGLYYEAVFNRFLNP